VMVPLSKSFWQGDCDLVAVYFNCPFKRVSEITGDSSLVEEFLASRLQLD
jgi:hypothetical protein